MPAQNEAVTEYKKYLEIAYLLPSFAIWLKIHLSIIISPGWLAYSTNNVGMDSKGLDSRRRKCAKNYPTIGNKLPHLGP